MAIAILGWPINVLAPEIAGSVIRGAQQVCKEAGIPLAGGHSIDAPEPIFGLAVTGRVPIRHLKRNGGAMPGDALYLTKPLGVGILSTAQKQKKIAPEHLAWAVKNMTALNTVGTQLGKIAGVRALTDVTGFGLLGHLGEMCSASGVSAQIHLNRVPFMDVEVLDSYLAKGCIPGGTHRNLKSYGSTLAPAEARTLHLLADPQTSGGLLLAVDPKAAPEVEKCLREAGALVAHIGTLLPPAKHLIEVL